ncbi:MAG TPA: flagellar basal body P-ring formation chaperone FlgA [Verrucomicrobiae bacterium]|jgi:flagella basal body P-ring formation protein FlgA|nr:flagellar basal body P-ring formation chaperone FlgA [Verrucomicrobiae bacterium]
MRELKSEIRNPKSEAFAAIRSAIFFTLVVLTILAGSVRADEASPAPGAVAPTQHTFEQADLVTLLTSALQQDYVKDKGELELRITQPWAAHTITNAPVTVKILEVPTMGVTSSFIVRFELLAGDKSIGSWQVPVQAHVWREVWVAHSMLKRGDAIADADLARERRDMLTIHEPLAEFTPGDSTLEIAEPVGVGAPLFARSIKLVPVVHRGQMVTALIEDGSFSVQMKVEALEDGSPGQIVRARNQQSLRDIRGKVLNEQTILVSL